MYRIPRSFAPLFALAALIAPVVHAQSGAVVRNPRATHNVLAARDLLRDFGYEAEARDIETHLGMDRLSYGPLAPGVNGETGVRESIELNSDLILPGTKPLDPEKNFDQVLALAATLVHENLHTKQGRVYRTYDKPHAETIAHARTVTFLEEVAGKIEDQLRSLPEGADEERLALLRRARAALMLARTRVFDNIAEGFVIDEKLALENAAFFQARAKGHEAEIVELEERLKEERRQRLLQSLEERPQVDRKFLEKWSRMLGQLERALDEAGSRFAQALEKEARAQTAASVRLYGEGRSVYETALTRIGQMEEAVAAGRATPDAEGTASLARLRERATRELVELHLAVAHYRLGIRSLPAARAEALAARRLAPEDPAIAGVLDEIALASSQGGISAREKHERELSTSTRER